MALFASGLDESFNNSCVYFTSCIITKPLDDIIYVVMLRREGKERAGEKDETENIREKSNEDEFIKGI
jgi:hypothetical protein